MVKELMMLLSLQVAEFSVPTYIPILPHYWSTKMLAIMSMFSTTVTTFSKQLNLVRLCAAIIVTLNQMNGIMKGSIQALGSLYVHMCLSLLAEMYSGKMSTGTYKKREEIPSGSPQYLKPLFKVCI